MKLHEFEIGKQFSVLGTKDIWLCTDKGTRVITAIKLGINLNDGPPYSVEEIVFDEDDMEACKV